MATGKGNAGDSSNVPTNRISVLSISALDGSDLRGILVGSEFGVNGLQYSTLLKLAFGRSHHRHVKPKNVFVTNPVDQDRILPARTGDLSRGQAFAACRGFQQFCRRCRRWATARPRPLTGRGIEFPELVRLSALASGGEGPSRKRQKLPL